MKIPFPRRLVGSVFAFLPLLCLLPDAVGQEPAPGAPVVERVSTISPDLLAIEIIDGERRQFPGEPYVAQPDDEIKYEGEEVLVLEEGEMKTRGINRQLYRRVDGRKQLVGYIVGGRDGEPQFQPSEQRVGEPLDVGAAEEKKSYRVAGKTPAEVHRKTKPIDRLQPNNEQIFRHVIYLKLAEPLTEGETVKIDFPGLALDQPTMNFTYDSKKVRSEAIHASLLGYRPDDPFKRAYLSIWLGTGGAYSFDGVDKFELLDAATGEAVFEGKVEELMAADGTEKLRLEKNYSMTAVYGLDFSEFDQPGEHLVHVPGVGVSDPVRIADDVWTEAFKVSMRGLLHNRSGIHLEKPWSEFDRPRDFHPDDGVKVFQSKVGFEEGNFFSGDSWFKLLTDTRTDEVVPDAWGGYHDAADFDRYSRHIIIPYLNLELYEMFPETVGGIKLALPPDEAGDNVPDILNEAQWGLAVWKRLQTEDGGIRTGIESSAHPRPAETSWEDSLVLMAYHPEPSGTWLYAGTAAKYARAIKPFDEAQANDYADSAERAFTWAESNIGPFMKSDPKFNDGFEALQRKPRALAAVELYALTNDEKYHEIFKEASGITGGQVPDGDEMHAALFTYANLPDELGDEKFKAKATKLLTNSADRALRFAEGNSFGLTTPYPGLPEMGPVGYFSTPEMTTRVLPRAHYLTHKEKYLAGAVRAANFSLGANPDNMTFTTGVGQRHPENPMHFDSRWSQQPAPSGITIYGQSDPARNDKFNAWVHKFFLKKMVPESLEWPATEAHVDDFMWPMMSEFTVWQNIAPTSYYWGYLAAREAENKKPEEPKSE